MQGATSIDVVVVGGGASGLSAMKQFQGGKRKVNSVVLLEAQDYLGGRVKTVRTSIEATGKTVLTEDGAEWVHGGRTTDLYRLAKKLNGLAPDTKTWSNIEHECRQRGLCLSDMPSLMNLRMNSSLLLINSVKSADIPPRPTVPSIIYAGGLHLKESKPLPKDLEDWVKGAGEEGFIFFSLGSAVVPSSMPEEYRKILVKTFGSLKQRVLWKWDKDTMDDLPPNVRLGT
ncbi:UDP-glucuronosyltransferase 2A1 [Halocaridina rubra]|uniref:UDP-glucuronosyltransferase 2A1 n=1 Tax=Halocaridina rubra TaxID=373956 RepID=A0AAN8XK08_HALRR